MQCARDEIGRAEAIAAARISELDMEVGKSISVGNTKSVLTVQAGVLRVRGWGR